MLWDLLDAICMFIMCLLCIGYAAITPNILDKVVSIIFAVICGMSAYHLITSL